MFIFSNSFCCCCFLDSREENGWTWNEFIMTDKQVVILKFNSIWNFTDKSLTVFDIRFSMHLTIFDRRKIVKKKAIKNVKMDFSWNQFTIKFYFVDISLKCEKNPFQWNWFGKWYQESSLLFYHNRNSQNQSTTKKTKKRKVKLENMRWN